MTLIRLNDTESTTITNPGYPSGYPGDQYNVWTVVPQDENHFVKLEINDLDLINAGDDLIIVDGDSLYDSPLLHHTGGRAYEFNEKGW